MGEPERLWTIGELRAELATFEQGLRAAGPAPNTVSPYVGRSEQFLRWLTGQYRPSGPR